jgi:acylphosphatase
VAEARRWLVSGRVQGVGFRAATRREALALGLCGHAHNLPDGRVEVLAGGDEAALQRLADWLHRGPPLANVDAVQDVPVERTPGAGFGVG